MPEENIPTYGGVIHPITGLPSSDRQPSRFKQRKPLGLALRKTHEAKPYRDPEPAYSESSCGICRGTLTKNPRICENCQIWNSAEHVFQCLRDIAKWEAFDSLRLGDLLDRKDCMMCQAIASAVLTTFPTLSGVAENELEDVEIRDYGPYCLGADALDDLDSKVLERSGRHRIDAADPRLSKPFDISSAGEENAETQLQVVLYLIVTSPLGSSLGKHIPKHDSYLSSEEEPQSKESTVQPGGLGLLLRSGYSEIYQPTIGAQLMLRYANLKTSLIGVERWENLFIDTRLLTEWIENCKTHHGSKCGTNNQASVPPGFKAIDTTEQCIVDLPSYPIPSYAALSYTWGASSGMKELQLERSNYADLQKVGALKRFGGIPDIIPDAITLCANLGEKYLWVDRLCILQDDAASKHSQIQAMDRIYTIADFTIVAAVPLGVGLPGVAGRPRKSTLENKTRRFHPKLRFIMDNFQSTAMSSFWNTRGWTYQERILSRRAIYITEFQVYFVCKRHSQQEDIGEIATTVNPWDLHKLPQYFATVADYTSRNLSFPSDILNAFAGIGNHFAKAQGKPLLFGLPEKYLPQALLWESEACFERRQDIQAPSWSWAAWVGRSKYELNSQVEKMHVGSLVCFYFQDPKVGLIRLHADEMWFFKSVGLASLERLPVIDPTYPEMRFMPAAEESEREWRDCMHNPWEVSKQSIDSTVAARASAYPGSLIFATTSAFVYLQFPNPHIDDGEPSYVKLNILNSTRAVIGQAAQLPYSWIIEHLDLNAALEAIVICAGILSEPSRFDHLQMKLQAESDGDTNSKGSPWYLHVMLVTRDTNGDTVHRVAIGVIKMPAWRRCDPIWRIIILA